jgi:predicted ribosome quality control (RQC) complex YloA/Tae2 family protein
MDSKIGKPKDQSMVSLFFNKHFNLVLYNRQNILTSILRLAPFYNDKHLFTGTNPYLPTCKITG